MGLILWKGKELRGRLNDNKKPAAIDFSTNHNRLLLILTLFEQYYIKITIPSGK